MLDLSRVTNILRFRSKSRKKEADPTAAAKRPSLQTYDAARGGHPTPTSQADDSSSGSGSASSAADADRAQASNSAAGLPIDARQLEKRQAEEKEFIRQHDSSEAQVWYLIDVQWLQAWKCFVTRNGELPGPIDNGRLVDRQTGQVKRGLHAVTDYRGVNGEIWQYWLRRYGGGPTVRRKQLDLYAPEVEEPPERPVLRAPLPPTAAPGGAVYAGDSARKGVEAASSLGARDSRGEETDLSSTNAGSTPGAASSTSSPAVQQGGRRTGSLFSSLGSRGSSSSGRSSQASPSASSPQPARRSDPTAKAPQALCCDKCDGPHETDRCPYFKKAREKHPDATSNLGKAKRVTEDTGDGAPIVRNAHVVPQPADGSCLFHSLSYGLRDRSTATSLRKEICGYIAQNPEMTIADTAIAEWIRYDSNDTVAQYAQRMANGNWGGGIEMAALTKMKNVNVHVYEKCREGYKRISAFESPGARKTVSVLYQGRMHYDAIEV